MEFARIAIIAAVVLFVVITLYSMAHKSAKRYYKKAEVCHQKGEYYHEIGDAAIANDYYKEASFFRKKAEELENVVS